MSEKRIITCPRCKAQTESVSGTIGAQEKASGWYPLFLATGHIVWLCTSCRSEFRALISPLDEFLSDIEDAEYAHWGSMRQVVKEKD